MKWKGADPDNCAHEIPLAELTRPDPILFYAEIPLYEDELHDNGSSNLLVRIVSLIPIFVLQQASHITNSVSCRRVFSFLHGSHCE